jgi:DNA-binding NtrC family response regulator
MVKLEHVVKEKVEPLLEEAMQRFFGITIKKLEDDITEKLGQNLLIGLVVRIDLPFKEAKRYFKKEFLERSIQTHYGNISEVADVVGLDRRSIHRDLKSLNVDMKKLRERLYKPGYFKQEAVDTMIRKTLNHYKSLIRPEKLELLYNYVPELSQQIVRVLPRDMKWKKAEQEFEKAYIKAILEMHHGSMTQTARRMGIRYETLLRKIKKLNLRL